MVQLKNDFPKSKVGRRPNSIPTKAIQLHYSLVGRLLKFKESCGFDELYRKDVGEILSGKPSASLSLPLFQSRIQAGFPSPCGDFKERSLDLNEPLVSHKAATFFMRVTGDSMTGVGIFPGDLLIVDRSLNPISGKVVIAVLNGEMTLKRLEKSKEGFLLCAENNRYEDIKVREEDDFSIWGVVTNVIHCLL
ncbi:MAG: translesion error-prone DNA polymerase V autoproteolytic subunit [Alphaproteobacteria bacterium]|nr:translesion error-prone DNA polymerase V autoproteolytic subunit [Alphaproteobacteria bacterium]